MGRYLRCYFMKIIIAPDSFKGCLRSSEVCTALKKGILSFIPDAEIISVPMADGGEGTVDSVVNATKGSLHRVTVTGPLGAEVEALYGSIGKTGSAVMEMASASGIELVPEGDLNPMKATTFGTGELINEILNADYKEIIIGIGGSATVDGGAGMAQALGFRFFDRDGNDVPSGGAGLEQIAEINTDSVNPKLKSSRIRVACDVTNPLLGANGAAKVFSPQKGADKQMVEKLESGLSNFSQVMISAGLIESVDKPGDGAAGGLGAGLRAFCDAEIVSGAELLIKINRLEDALKEADVLITGEGCTDSQTCSGKLCSVIAQKASEFGVKILLVSGLVKGDKESYKEYFSSVFSISEAYDSIEQAILDAEDNLIKTGKQIAQQLL